MIDLANELLVLYFIDPPTVIKLSKHYIIEGRELIVKCQAKLGNPNITTFFWTKVDQPDFQQNRSTLQLPNIERSRSGIYICTAENNYSNGEKGTHSQLMDVIVFCKCLLFLIIFKEPYISLQNNYQFEDFVFMFTLILA